MPEYRNQTIRQAISECIGDQLFAEREGTKATTKRKGSKCIDCFHAWVTDFENCEVCEAYSHFVFWQPDA